MAPENHNGSGSMVKIPWFALVTLISWLVAVVMAYSMMETKDHADKTFLRKDVFEQFANRNSDDMKEVKQMLQSITDKLDKKEDRKGSQ